MALALLCIPVFVFAEESSVSAEVSTETSVTTGEEGVSVEGEEELEGVIVQTPAKAPTGLGIFFRTLRERFSIALTVDPVKKAEKQVVFAEERIKIADKIAQESDSAEAQARAATMIDRAESLLDRVNEQKERWLKRSDERTKRLIRNIATHEANRWSAIERVEDEFGDTPATDRLRDRAKESGERLLNAIHNEQLSPELKEHLENVKARIEASAQIKMEFKKKKQELLEKAHSGDEQARETLQKLPEERKEKLGEIREEFKMKQEEFREKKSVTTTKDFRAPVMKNEVESKGKIRAEMKENVREQRKERQ